MDFKKNKVGKELFAIRNEIITTLNVKAKEKNIFLIDNNNGISIAEANSLSVDLNIF